MEIQNLPGYLIRRLNQISVSIFQDHMMKTGIKFTPVQFAALNMLKRFPNTDQATLAGLIAYDRATIGGVIDRLESLKLVNRSVSKHDRRAHEIILTPLGLETLEKLLPVIDSIQEDILAGLTSKDRVEFLRLASILASAGNHLSRAPMVLPNDDDI